MAKRMDFEMQTKFLYLFERMNEPLGMGMKGPKDRMVYYNMSPANMDSQPSPSMMNTMTPTETINVKSMSDSDMPMENLKMISSLCPRNGIFGYFIPEHAEALVEMRRVLMKQNSIDDLFNMACACRDSKMVHPHLFVNALAATLATHKETKGFQMPAFHEVMPDLFYSGHVMKQAERMAKVLDKDKMMIMLDSNVTGDHKDPESRLWYFREDVGVNSHHFHWHVVFPGTYIRGVENRRSRRGELFYYMHHSMMARYDAERLCVGMARAKMFNFDDLVLTEGYFGKLFSTNSGRNWGNRQANTKLTDVNRYNGQSKLDTRIEDLKKWRDRILDVIDTGYYIRKDPVTGTDKREKLDITTGIDVLGDIIENSGTDTPHAQFYGPHGLHNMGHRVIAFIHDPIGEYRENPGPMGDTSTAMRDPMFYRWHKYIDHMFIQYKNTLPPYPLQPASDKDRWPLIWDNVVVEGLDLIENASKRVTKELTTHWAMRDVDLARGLDFWRNSIDNMDPVYARVTFIDYSPFKYSIKVRNNNRSAVKATVRIFLAPVKDEHEKDFPLDEQRHLFYEMDKFSHTLTPGQNTITRESVDSVVTVKTENLFRQLEELDRDLRRQNAKVGDFKKVDAACGCGWPQNLLLTKGTASGMQFDLYAIITDGSKDGIGEKKGCRDAMSFCGIIDEDFPDKRPMGYPFDRLQFNEPGTNNRVSSIDKYASHIPNAINVKISIKHDSKTPPRLVDKLTIKGMKMVDETGNVMEGSVSPAKTGRPPPTSENRGDRQGGWITSSGSATRRPPPQQKVPSWGGPQPAGWSRQRSRQGRQDSESWEHLDEDEFQDEYDNEQY